MPSSQIIPSSSCPTESKRLFYTSVSLLLSRIQGCCYHLSKFLIYVFSSVQFSHSVVSNSLRLHGLYSPWNSLGQNTGVGSLSLLQGIFPTQGSNPGLLHSRHILYRLSHQGKPKNTGVGGLSLLQGIFPTQESNQGLLNCRQILYHLSYQGW